MSNKIISILVMITMFISALYMVSAIVPLGPSTWTPGLSEKQDETAYPAGQHEAYAGNITNITIHALTQTKHWQGYYGDITGTIVLDDAQNWTLYDWPNLEPKGEIYATPNSSIPDWPNVECFNFVDGIGGGDGNVTAWEAIFNMTANVVDGIDETFNMTRHHEFSIGDVNTIDNSTCPSTFMHMNDEFQEDKWQEVLLQDQTNGYLIFTAIIENDDYGMGNSNDTDIQGFKGSAAFTPDFQMIVAEDGTSKNSGTGEINVLTTTYYFYLDLE